MSHSMEERFIGAASWCNDGACVFFFLFYLESDVFSISKLSTILPKYTMPNGGRQSSAIWLAEAGPWDRSEGKMRLHTSHRGIVWGSGRVPHYPLKPHVLVCICSGGRFQRIGPFPRCLPPTKMGNPLFRAMQLVCHR